MLNFYQTDQNALLMGDGLARQSNSKPDRGVLVEPPARPQGKVARWETALDHNVDAILYGTEGTGAWVLDADHRKTPLFITTDGAAYTLDTETEAGAYAGYGDLPAWLTDIVRPSRFHSWVDGAWVLDLDAELVDTKAAKLLEIDRDRDVALAAGFEHDGHTFDSDQKSIQRINAIATLALMDPGFETPYITQANETIILDTAAIRALGVAAAQHESSMVFQARTLKDQVLAATTKASVDAIVWALP